MTPDVVLTLAVTLGSLILFAWGRWRMDVVGILVMTVLVVSGVVRPADGIAGFANEATVTVALMLALSTGLLHTGAIDALAARVEPLVRGSEIRLLLVTIGIVVPLSAVINNTAAVAILIPMVVGLCRSIDSPPSHVLMPLSFASQMGGTLTLVGTSTNLLVAGMVLDLGLERFTIFEITPAGAVMAGVGLVYLVTLGRWLTPTRSSVGTERTSHDRREYLSELIVSEDSRLVGHRSSSAEVAESFDLRLVGVWREGEDVLASRGDIELEVGDILVVRGKVGDIDRAEERNRLVELSASTELGRHDELQLAELMVSPRSGVIDVPLEEVQEALPEAVVVLAVERHGASIQGPLAKATLAAGDILLVRGPEEGLLSLHQSGDFALIGIIDVPRRRTRKMKIAIPIVIAVVLLAATGTTTILVAALLGVLAMVLTGCATPETIYEEMDWRIVILLGSLLSLATALQETGTAELIADGVLSLISGLGPYGLVGGFYLLTTVLTSIMTNNAAALVLAPVAVSAAESFGISPRPLVVAVMFAASNAFATPIGYQTNLFIYGPGGYRFTDFVRVGLPLVLVFTAVATFVVPVFFPF